MTRWCAAGTGQLLRKSANLKITCMAKGARTSGCAQAAHPGMNSGSDRSSSLKRAPQTTRFSAVDSCQAGDSIPSRPSEPLQPSLTTHHSQITFSCLHDVRQHMAAPSRIANQRTNESLTFTRFCVQSTPENYRTQIFLSSAFTPSHVPTFTSVAREEESGKKEPPPIGPIRLQPGKNPQPKARTALPDEARPSQQCCAQG